MSETKYEYDKFMLILDPNDKEDAAIAIWLKTNRTKSKKITDHLRMAMIAYITQTEAAKKAKASEGQAKPDKEDFSWFSGEVDKELVKEIVKAQGQSTKDNSDTEGGSTNNITYLEPDPA